MHVNILQEYKVPQRRNWKLVARKIVEQLPNNGGSLKKAYRFGKLVQLRIQTKTRRIFNNYSIPDTETIYWISPERIELYTNHCGSRDVREFQERFPERVATQNFREQVFDRDKDKGKVYGGNWDISEYRFTELEIYKAFEARILSGAEWEETDFYQTTVSRIKQGNVLWGCDNEEKFVERCDYLDRLIESIKDQGYRLNSDVLIQGDDPQSLTKHKETGSEVLVNVGRNGEYLFQDSRHRLAIAKILDIDKIPVKVLVRHEQWQELREHLSTMLANSAGASKRGVLYQSPIHPDLSDFPATHACEDRFELIKEHLVGHSGNLLDLGASLGYFCHRCEDLGFNCYAIELLPEVVWAADRIRRAERKNFQIIEGDLITACSSAPLNNLKFDTVIALNIMHWFLMTKDKYEQLKSWLQTLRVERMFLEVHRTDEFHMIDAYANLEPDEFVSFVLENSSLKNAEFLSHTDDGRRMYKLTS